MLEVMLADARFSWRAHTATDWNTPPADWVQTTYQRKAIAAGRIPTWLDFTPL